MNVILTSLIVLVGLPTAVVIAINIWLIEEY
jgi:hypothetical protein